MPLFIITLALLWNTSELPQFVLVPLCNKTGVNKKEKVHIDCEKGTQINFLTIKIVT